MKKFLKKIIIYISLLILSSQLFCIELAFKLSPNAIFPFLTPGEPRYALVGGGAFLDAGANFFDFLYVSPEFGFFVVPKQSADALEAGQDKVSLFIPIGGQIGFYFFPFSRVELDIGVAGGGAIKYQGGRIHEAPWYRGYGDIFFRINPNISVGLNASWFDVQFDTWWNNAAIQSLNGGISVKYTFDTEKASENVNAEIFQDESVFPLFYTIYKENYFGTITITNNETAEIRDISVSFSSEGYTNAPILCGKVKQLRKHKSEEIPLCADFSETILQFTENGKIPAEIIVEYEMLGQKRKSVTQVIVPVYNRNQVRWTDPAVIASYISTSAQEVLEFSKYLVGVARTYLRSGLNRNMQFAMYVFEGIRLAGIKCEPDPSTPYDTYHLNSETLDYIQYPYQTMLYKTGDKDDVGILLMAVLQSVGIDASFITTNDDFIVLLNTGVNASKAASLFDGFDRVLVFDDEVWIPLSMKTLNEGFVNSWYTAIVEIQEATEAEEEMGFVSLAEAWTYYPPAGFTSGEHVEITSTESDLAAAVETDIARYITAEFGPQIAAIQNRIRQEGASVDLYNKLGMLYVRAGMYSSAIPVYTQSAKLGSITAMNNLGNIASLQKKFTEAQLWYRKVLELDPNNKTAIKNLNRIQSELEKY